MRRAGRADRRSNTRSGDRPDTTSSLPRTEKPLSSDIWGVRTWSRRPRYSRSSCGRGWGRPHGWLVTRAEGRWPWGAEPAPVRGDARDSKRKKGEKRRPRGRSGARHRVAGGLLRTMSTRQVAGPVGHTCARHGGPISAPTGLRWHALARGAVSLSPVVQAMCALRGASRQSGGKTMTQSCEIIMSDNHVAGALGAPD